MKIVSAAVLIVFGLGSLAIAGEAAEKKDAKKQPEKKKTQSVYAAAVPKKKDPEAKVWTNADLEELGRDPFATSPVPPDPADPAAPGPPAAGGDSLQWLEDQEKSAQARNERIATAQAELDAAQAKLANLEKQLLATVNPFSARPQLSEEEKERRRTSGEDAKTRHDRTQKMVDEARAEVAAAQTELQRAKAGR